MSRKANAFSVCSTGLGAALVLLYATLYSKYGFDFTDEAYYAIWMSDPFYYDWSVSQFGFVYKSLFDLLSGNIAMIRAANLAVTFALSFVLSFKVFVLVDKGRSLFWTRAALSAGLATSSLAFLYRGISTPSYNTLAFQALLITAIGQLYAQPLLSRTSLTGWIIVGVGGWLTFMAKPSSAAALAVWVLVYVLMSGKWSLRALIVAAATAILLLVLSAIGIDGSITKFVNRIAIGIELSKHSGAGYSLEDALRLDNFSLNEFEKMFAAVLFLSVTASTYIFNRSGKKWIACLKMVIAATAIFLTAAAAWGWPLSTDRLGPAAGLTMLAIPLSAILISVLPLQRCLSSSVPRPKWSAAISFLLFPLIYSFGSNGNYWHFGSSAAIFWLLTGVLLSRDVSAGQPALTRFVPVVLAAQFVTMVLLFARVERPYRQPEPLWLNNEPIEIGRPRSVLILSRDYGAYVQEAKEKAAQTDFKAGTPVIDLTGQSPGVLYALQARSAGYPWLAGSYPGSANVARAAIARMSCSDMSKAWVLAEPGGPRAIDDAVLDAIGARLRSDYGLVATWETAAGAGGFREKRLQQLWKPIRPQLGALAACEAARSAAR